MADQRKGLFGKQAVSPVAAAPPMHQEFNKLNTRIRISEERYVDMRKKITLIESNMLANHRKALHEIRSLAGDLLEMKRSIADMKNRMMLVIKELQLTAKNEDLQVIKKYLEFWEPVKFATMNQVEKMIEEALEEKKRVVKSKV